MLIVVKKANLTYFIKKESVIVEIPHSPCFGNTYVSFNCYQLQSRKKFNCFQKQLAESQFFEYDTLNDIFGLATEYGLRATGSHKPVIVGNIAF